MRRNAKCKSILTSLSAPVAILPKSAPTMVVDCNEESRGTTSASSQIDSNIGTCVPVNDVGLTEVRGLPLPRRMSHSLWMTLRDVTIQS